jgi:hypothetical protein
MPIWLEMAKGVVIIDGAGNPLELTAASPLPVALSGGQATFSTQDGGLGFVSSLGVNGAAVTSANMTVAVVVTDAPTVGQFIVVDDIIVSADTIMNITLTEETSGVVKARFYLPANGSVQLTTRGRFKLATANKRLMAVASVAGNVAITVLWHSED